MAHLSPRFLKFGVETELCGDCLAGPDFVLALAMKHLWAADAVIRCCQFLGPSTEDARSFIGQQLCHGGCARARSEAWLVQKLNGAKTIIMVLRYVHLFLVVLVNCKQAVCF